MGNNVMTFDTCACCVKNEIFIYPTYKHNIVDVYLNVFKFLFEFFSYYYCSDKIIL